MARSQTALLTRKEVAELSGVSTNVVNKALEQGVARRRKRGGQTMLEPSEALVLAVISELPSGLSVKLKRELRNWLLHTSARVGEAHELSPALRVAVTEHAAEVARRTAEYVRLRDELIEVDGGKMGGAPVIRDTRVPVRTLARLVEAGASRKELREDYPHVPEEAYDLAVVWARAHPPRGRPVQDSGGRRRRGRSPVSSA